MTNESKSTKTYRIRLYLLQSESESPRLLYGCIFPWKVSPEYLNQILSKKMDTSIGKLGTVFRLDFALNEENADKFFSEILNKTLAEISFLDKSKIKESWLLSWKFPETHQVFSDVFLEKENGYNVLREHRSWQNLVMLGSARADILLELNKDPFFQLEENVFQELNSFFKEEIGFDLFINQMSELYPKGEEWKRLGNLEWIRYIGQQKENEFYSIEITKENVIRFLLMPEISEKAFIAVSFQISNFGLMHSHGMKTFRRSHDQKTIVEFPLGNRDYCQGHYQIFEGDSSESFKLIIEDRIQPVREINIGLGLRVGLLDLEVPKSSANKFLSELSGSHDLRNVKQKVLENPIVIKSRETGDMFSQLLKYEELLYKKRKKDTKSYSKFFAGDASDKLEFGLFIQNLASSDRSKKPSAIYVMDPFANEDVVTSLMVHQNVPVHVILNSSQTRNSIEGDENPNIGSDLIQSIVSKCLEYIHMIPGGSSITDINRKDHQRSFHDRYIFVEYADAEEDLDGYLLSSSLSSYFAGTPASLSKLNSETTAEMIQYIKALMAGHSSLKKWKEGEVDLNVEEIWPKQYDQNVFKSEESLSQKYKECLESGMRLLDRFSIPVFFEVHEELIGEKLRCKPIFNSEVECNLDTLTDNLQKISDEELYNFFGLLNILLGHTPFSSESNFERSIFTSFLLKDNIKAKYREYILNLKDLPKPIGIKEEVVTYDQLPKLIQIFQVRKGLPHYFVDEISRRHSDSGSHFDQVLMIFQKYFSYDPNLAISILEEALKNSDFFNIINKLNSELDIRKIDLSARLGQKLSVSLVHEVGSKYVGEFIKSLIDSNIPWIHQLGIVAYYYYSTNVLNSIRNEEFRKVLEESLEIPLDLTQEEELSLNIAIFKKMVEIKNSKWGSNYICLKIFEKLKKSIIEEVGNTNLDQRAKTVASLLLSYRNSLKELEFLIKELEVILAPITIDEVRGEIIKQIIISKLFEKQGGRVVDRKVLFIYLHDELIQFIGNLRNKDFLAGWLLAEVKLFKRKSETIFNDPFIIKKDLNLIRKRVEGLAWLMFFMDWLGIEEAFIQELDDLIVENVVLSNNSYFDWPPFSLFEEYNKGEQVLSLDQHILEDKEIT